ncbi:MAG: Gfo/Idh/MocA family oxidoreductase [Chryseolinea sp.]
MNDLLTSKVYSRKTFLTNVSAGLLTTGIMNGPTLSFSKQDQVSVNQNFDSKPLPRSPLNADTEQEEPKFFPSPTNPQKRIGYAIVGLGHLTLGEIMPAFSACKFSKPVALISGDEGKAGIVADQYGIDSKNIYNYNSFDRIKDNKEIDAVYIVLPNSMHHEFTIRAANAGKHVLCEKPMANSVKECEEMISACAKANKKLMIAYRIQYEPNNHLIMNWVRNKEYGNAKLLELYNGQNIGDPSQWRLKKSLAGGGSLVDVGIYCLNTCRFLLGEEPESVFGKMYSTPGDNRFKEVEESVLFQLHFPSGVMANCITTYGAHMNRRYRVFTDKGSWFGMDPAFSYRGVKIESAQAKGKLEWKQSPTMEEKNQFALEIDHLSQSILNNTIPFTKGEEGFQDQKIMEAIYMSANEGRIINLEKISGKDIFRGNKPAEE